MVKSRVIERQGGRVLVSVGDEIVDVGIRGRLKLDKRLLAGDYVSLEQSDGIWLIREILPRINELRRPALANVDQVLIVMSAHRPEFSGTLVDRLIFLVVQQGIRPVIVLTKSDLAHADDPIYHAYDDYRQAGYDILMTDKTTPVAALASLFADKVSVLAGQSGVGKSSLLNRLDLDLDLETQEISEALGRGKHTTTRTRLFPIAGGWVADTPGFSSLDFSHIHRADLRDCVPDFQPYVGMCRFSDCLHVQEPGCLIKQLVAEGKLSKQRYTHYVQCLDLCTKE